MTAKLFAAALVALSLAACEPPKQATVFRVGAECSDGTTSDAIGSGACSGHGGVKCWKMSDGHCWSVKDEPPHRIGAECKDGVATDSTGRGACSGHGGVLCWKYSDGSCSRDSG